MQQVEEFKRENISCIDSLPPAEQLVWKLFPQCMVRLMLSWMLGKSQGDNEQNHSESLETHTSERVNEKPGTAYPGHCERTNIGHLGSKVTGIHSCHHTDKVHSLAQIILEFANNTLVSGVAHVVYSRL